MHPDATPRRRLLRLGGAVFAIVLLALPAALRPAAAADAGAAEAVVQKVSDEVLDVLRSDALSDEEKFERLIPILDGPIELELVARLILGRHWRSASEAQRERYLELFREYALENLASKLHMFEGQDLEITSAKPAGGSDAIVTTRITTTEDRPPLRVDWRLRERDGGDFVAIDVIVEGVSLIVSLRSEFGSVIERNGMDGLLDELEHRIDQIRA